MTERQRFEVKQSFDGFELRQYEPCSIAEVTVNDSYSSASTAAFRPLFSYISQGNSQSQSIAMTAPVIASTAESLDSHHWRVAFVMPAGMKVEDLPLPSETTVSLREMPSEKCVALSFRGRATQSLSEKKERELRELAAAHAIALSSETRICRFDPPFKPGFMMYNEIVIPVLSV
jgi:hypothetical protein